MVMQMYEFHGIYAGLLKQYISFKRSLGYKFVDAYFTYSLFDRMTLEREETTIGITRDLADAWAKQRPNESDSTRYRRVMYLIQFSRYLCDLSYDSFVPIYPATYKSTFVPYILTKQQMNDIFKACDSIKIGSLACSQAVVIPALLRLMYGTGIRVGEAVSLLKTDVDLDSNTLIIHNSKNGKERMIPFATSVAEACREYRSSLPENAVRASNFFVRRNGMACNKKHLYDWFRKVLFIAGISHGGRGNGPRLHDVRHCFSIHSLAKMAADGVDLYYSLPILSEYLGHQSLEATEKYVRLTAEMYPGLISQANNICSYAFPEVGFTNDD
jgi:integrase/recombinase XerD